MMNAELKIIDLCSSFIVHHSTLVMANPQASLPSLASGFGARFRAWSRRRALSPTGNTGDTIFRAVLFFSALLLLLLVMAMVIAMAVNSKLSLRQFGFGFLTSHTWNPIQ